VVGRGALVGLLAIIVCPAECSQCLCITHKIQLVNQ
jgi:hypothetical protein